jgi:uncharacterized protein (DUF924 family)
MADHEQVLEFWLKEVGPERWYAATPELDAEMKRRFEGDVIAARRGELDAWILHPEEALALMLLLDQFPRNIWRGAPESFSSDAHAVAMAKRALNSRHDEKVPEPERQFFYLPLMHHESQMDQDRCVRLILTKMPETGAQNLEHAIAHRDVIRKFGRFPFRNAALARQDTPEEAAWLAAGGYRA